MANPAPVFFNLDPNSPQGSESLKLGPSRIRAIPTAILDIFGLPDTAVGASLSPIQNILNQNDPTSVQLQAWNQPTDDLAYATKNYTDRRALFVPLDASGGPVVYTATIPDASGRAPFAFDPNGLLLVINNGATNTGAASLQINALGLKSIVHLDGSDLIAGDFVSGGLYALALNGALPGASLRILGFVGGGLTQPITLPTQAATKQYVDATITAPMNHALAGTVVLVSNAITPLFGSPIAIVLPSDGPYLLHVSYLLYFKSTTAGASFLTAAWATDGGANLWAPAGLSNFNLAGGGTIPDGILAGNGFSPVAFAAGATVNLSLVIQSADAGSVLVSSGPPDLLGPAPASFLAITLVRSH